MSTAVQQDGNWIDDQFAPLDTRTGTFADLITEIGNEPENATEFAPEPVATEPVVTEEVIQSEYPQVIEIDGGQIVIDQTKKGLKATLDSGVRTEVFYGKDKDQLLSNVLKGKAHATRAIHDLTQRSTVDANHDDPNPPGKTRLESRQLTADDMLAIKTKMQSDPSAALDEWFQKKTGMSAEALVQLAQEGQEANLDLYMESVATRFRTERPNYYNSNENMVTLTAALYKAKFNRSLPRNQAGNTLVDYAIKQMARAGFWTVENLTAYFDDLLQGGLLDTVEEDEDEVEETPVVEKPAAVAAPAAAPAPDPRIAARRSQPRASFGISERAATVPAAATEQGPSDDDLNNLSDEQVAAAFAAVRRLKMGTSQR
jgi:hypothetical protein